jgi:hypothetical protein
VLFVYAGLALGRGLALILGERPGVMMAVFLVIEIGYAGAALLALRK